MHVTQHAQWIEDRLLIPYQAPFQWAWRLSLT